VSFLSLTLPCPFLSQLFEDNFIHGDLHPGNLLLTYDTSAPTHIFSLSHQPVQLTVLDTGLCTELNAEDRKNFVTLLKLVIEGDGVGVARLMMDKSRERNPKQVIIDPQGFERSMDHLLSNIFHNGGLKLANNGVSKLLNEVLLLCYKHRVRLESGFSSVMLAIGIVEGVGIQLDPEIDVVSRAAPFIIKTAARDFGLLPKQ
jgi:aarF domain-containing kinase